ncbi:MAG: hypothetical protein KC609_13610, partial [Myxococcales bacterium]|nr:hypothetical protein [Myxococcales bacterium]
RAGLRRVTLGMESGSPAVLERLGKPTSAAEILSVVERMKAAGLLVNLVLLVGAGGERLRAAHVDQTVALLSQMPLERRDRIFLSELVLAESAPLLGQEPQSAQLDAASLAAESASLRSALRQLDAHPQIARYDIREFHG